MCLYKITNEIKTDEGIAWKVFGKSTNGHLMSLLFRETVRTDRWLEADRIRSALGYCKLHEKHHLSDYRHGFHMYANFPDAYRLAEMMTIQSGCTIVIKEVVFRNLLCSGRSINGRLEIVVERMYVPSDTEWAPILEVEDCVQSAVGGISCASPACVPRNNFLEPSRTD